MYGVIIESGEIIDSSSVSTWKVVDKRDLFPNIKQFVDLHK